MTLIRPVPYLTAFVISSLAMKPSGMAVAAGSSISIPSTAMTPPALRGQHHGEFATKVLDKLLERKGRYAIE